MNNKEASTIQERMVAKYMGWNVVTGSGSRPFRPGDIKSDNFLLECKTHTKEQANIVFYEEHWNKIVIEARAVNKYPALVVDNGTQKAECTWVAVPRRIVTNNTHTLIRLNNTSTKGTTVTFNHGSTYSLYKSEYELDSINFFQETLGNNTIAIFPLSEFAKFYSEEFES